MGPEAKVERTVRRDAVREGWTVRKLVFPGTRGAPDRLFGKAGRSVLIEFKSAAGEASPQQLRRHKELRDVFGFDVRVCSTVVDGWKILGLTGDL